MREITGVGELRARLADPAWQAGGMSDYQSETFQAEVPDTREEQLDQDQLQPYHNLENRGVDDFLDEGYSPPEKPSVLLREGEHDSMDARLGEEHGPDAVWAAVSHGDVIKAVLADALGMHLDAFQRIVVDPASISVVTYTDTRPFVVRVNDTGGDVSALIPPKKKRGRRRPSSDAVVGGGAGSGAA